MFFGSALVKVDSLFYDALSPCVRILRDFGLSDCEKSLNIPKTVKNKKSESELVTLGTSGGPHLLVSRVWGQSKLALFYHKAGPRRFH